MREAIILSTILLFLWSEHPPFPTSSLLVHHDMWVWPPDPLQLWFQLGRMDRQKDMQQRFRWRVRRERQRSTNIKCVCACAYVCVGMCHSRRPRSPRPHRWILCPFSCFQSYRIVALAPYSEFTLWSVGSAFSPPPSHLPNWISCGESPLNKCTSQPWFTGRKQEMFSFLGRYHSSRAKVQRLPTCSLSM